MSASSTLPLLWFVVVVAAIPLVLWVLKRTPLGAGAGHAQLMRTVASHALSPSQRLVTVEVGAGDDKRWLVLGVTAQSITTVYMMVPQDEHDGSRAPTGAAAETPVPPLAQPFARMLRAVRGDAPPAN